MHDRIARGDLCGPRRHTGEMPGFLVLDLNTFPVEKIKRRPVDGSATVDVQSARAQPVLWRRSSCHVDDDREHGVTARTPRSISSG